MKKKYLINFESVNSKQRFTLEFTIAGGRIIHLIQSLSVYQHQGDLFASVLQKTDNSPWRFYIETMFSDHRFNIEIHLPFDEVEVFILESVIQTIHHSKNLQPCKAS